VLSVAQRFDEKDAYSSRIVARSTDLSQGFRFGVPVAGDMEFFGDTKMRHLFEQAINRTVAIGGLPVTIDLKPFRAAATLLYEGPWVAERVAAIGKFCCQFPGAILPVIETILIDAQKWSAVDAFEAQYRLAELKRLTEPTWQGIDVMLLPTTGTTYTIAQVNADPIKLNRNLGYYTNFVNLLDLCAVALPAGFLPSGVPGGISFIAPSGDDAAILALGRIWEQTGAST